MSLFSDARHIVSLTTKHSDLALVGLLVAVIALMIMPLPTALVDTLIGANLALSFAIMMMTMYVRTPLEFSSFPTMLLFTTLFRVGLNITTTRLILLNADAGEIIQTFGEFALGGNFVVGAVVFLILTIVQFLVIAKGAERVAEVGARFTLDAMPGKQMSIDADMRAGVIDMEEAQRRREVISQESKMFGAMDGAMKFVKGDSIAGMIVAVVNIVGGTVIGITQHGISAGEALEIYGILTIGDGLVSQIPSLIIAISAGILITRSGDSQEDVGAQIGGQFFAQPKALLMAGGLIFLFALIPVSPSRSFSPWPSPSPASATSWTGSAPPPRPGTPARNSASPSSPPPARNARGAPPVPRTISRPRSPSSWTSRKAWPRPWIMTASTTSFPPCAVRCISTLACPFPASICASRRPCRAWPMNSRSTRSPCLAGIWNRAWCWRAKARTPCACSAWR